jgi:hypothetical protein
LNIHKIQTVAKKALAAALPLALCFSIAGCSLKFKIFDNSDFKPTSESEALLSEIPEPKQTSYSYSAITNEHIKNLYAQIENECQKPVPAEIQCTGTLTQKDIYEAIIAFKNDHPDIFWIKNTFSYYDYDGSTYVELFYISSGTTLETQKEKFNEALNDFVNNATMYSSEYEREKYVNDYIISNCVYDDEAAYNNNTKGNVSTAYGVLVDGKAICEGYARAFQLLCNKLGIECVSIAGMTGAYDKTYINRSLNYKLDKKPFDTEPKYNSPNYITSGTVYNSVNSLRQTVVQNKADIEKSLANKYDAANNEIGSGELSPGQTIYEGSAGNFVYAKNGDVVTVSVNITSMLADKTYLQMTGLPFPSKAESRLASIAVYSTKNNLRNVRIDGSWIYISAPSDKFVEDEKMNFVVTYIIRR